MVRRFATASNPARVDARALRYAAWRTRRLRVAAEHALRAVGGRPTSGLRTLPGFLVIGAQKSGTTSLFQYLARHPGIALATPKEVHYFDFNHHRGVGWYRSHFPLARSLAAERRAAIGEVTPGYLFDPDVPARVYAHDPGLKLIALLRDPVDRALSHYHHERGRGREWRTFEQAVEDERRLDALVRRRPEDASLARVGVRRFPAYLARGLYAEQLERWLELFPREQLLVVLSDELARDPRAALARIAAFLDVPEHELPEYRRYRTGRYAPMANEVRAELAGYFEGPNRRLLDLLGVEPDWSRRDVSGAGATMRTAR
jgi:hypothetical protein